MKDLDVFFFQSVRLKHFQDFKSKLILKDCVFLQFLRLPLIHVIDIRKDHFSLYVTKHKLYKLLPIG